MQVVSFSKALADESRVRLINLLLRHELNVGEIVEALGMGQSRVSRHLRILADSGLVHVRREGLWAFYVAVDEGPARAFMDCVSGLWIDEPGLRSDLEQARAVVHKRVLDTRRFFDEVAPEWDRLSRDVLGELDLREEILSRVEGRVSAAVDLGCGPGDLLEGLAARASKVIGVDNSPKMLDLARERFQDQPGVSLRIGELTHLPLRDWEADLVVLSMVLHHLSEPGRAIDEAGRVLKMGGRLMVAEFDLHQEESMREEYGDHRLGIDREDMRRMLAKSHFRIEQEAAFPVRRGLTVILYACTRA